MAGHFRFKTIRNGLRMSNHIIEERGIDVDVELKKEDVDTYMDSKFEKDDSFISVSTSLKLPFCADTAFSAFSDLPRQPSWSSWLHSVSYIYPTPDCTEKNVIYTECGIPLLETKWIMKWKKISFSWKSKVTKIERPNLIQWESTSGLKNKGEIIFMDLKNATDPNEKALVSLTLSFVTPRIVATLLKRSDAVSDFMQRKILLPTLENFRDVISHENQNKIH
jgi:uncharacterized membrane protein